MRAFLFLLAACGGGGGNPGKFEATVTIDGVPRQYNAGCDLTESTEFFDIFTSNGNDLAFEMKWKKDRITAPGTYTSMGVVDDLAIFALQEIDVMTANGTVTFTTFDPPSVVIGTFDLNVPNRMFVATGLFDCR